ncbi:MAG: rRNA pseudouridine synthase [Chloroflexi bacterium]|nr:rRNA pseudouridine synthase [Chloroflexota bacterium]
MAAERLQKVLAQAGVASRREAERWIVAGRVRVNGEVVRELGAKASPDEDTIEVDGLHLTGPETFEYYALHKPVGVVTTVKDPQRRPTVMHLLASVAARVYPVGRLDADSEGLLLLTNDGELAHRLTHPRFGVEKEYEAELDRPVDQAALDTICRGIESQGQQLAARSARIQPDSGGRVVMVVLAEGRKREVRRMFEALDRRVLRLLRVRFGAIALADLAPGRFRTLTKDEIEQLRAATSA